MWRESPAVGREGFTKAQGGAITSSFFLVFFLFFFFFSSIPKLRCQCG